MSEDEFEFPPVPLSPSLPADFEPAPAPVPAKPRPAAKPARSPTKPAPPAGTSPGPSPRASPLRARHARANGTTPGEEPAEPRPVEPRPALSPRDERRAALLKQRMGRWIDRARAKKHESDRANADRMHVPSMLLAIDALVCFMIAFDFEDRADAVRAGQPELGKPSHARSWATLIPFLVKVSAKAESVDADLAGICYFVSGVVSLHVAYLQRRSAPPETHARDLYRSLADFRRALHLLPSDVVRSRYNMDSRTGWDRAKVDPDRPDPVHNRAALPLHVNSSLAEAAAFAMNVARIWASQEGIEYQWEAATPVE